MTFNRIIAAFTFPILLLFASGCTEAVKAEQVPLPSIGCKTMIVVEQGSDFKINEYCSIAPKEMNVSLLSDPETEQIGSHTVQILISDGKHNNFLIKDLNYEVVKSQPECPENSSWDKESESCRCIDGYKDMGKEGDIACAIIPACKIGYVYDEKTNTCIKRKTATSSAANATSTDTGSASQSSVSSSATGNSEGSASTEGGTSESYTIDYEDYQPSNGNYDVTITNNNTGESVTVTDQNPPAPGSNDDEFFEWINEQLP